MLDSKEIQYISDAHGNVVGVIVPIQLWRSIAAEWETAYLLNSEAMKNRLLQAKQRNEGVALEGARETLGI